MPVLRIILQHKPTEADGLRDRLVNEWRHPDEEATEPLIIEEGESAELPSHLRVVWSDWSHLDGFERSMIIMTAYEEVYGPERVLTVMTAEGLTPEEAKRMGIESAPREIAA